MGGEASVWNPQTVLNLSANTKRIEQRFTAAAGQTMFTLTSFTYALNTGSLAVYRKAANDTSDSGAGLLAEGVNWTENTTSTFSLVKPCEAGDTIIAVGYVAITGAVDVRDTDIFVANYQALRDYAGAETTLWAQGKTVAGDGGEFMFTLRTGEAPGYYVDDGYEVIVPTGGNGSSAWTCKKQVKYYTTVASLQASKKVIAGDIVNILARGSAQFTLSSSGTADGYRVIQLTASGLYATLNDTSNVINPIKWGAALDGVANDTLVLKAIANYINAEGGGYTVDFGENTSVLISYQGAAYASTYGYVVMDFVNAPNTHLKGKNVTVRCVNHNITTYGGFLFAQFAACPGHSAEGFYFDMTFTGYNTSGSYYPFCGAIIAIDPQTGAVAQSGLNSNVQYKHMRFKLYHEKGSYMQSPNAFSGDPNNGFKVFSLFNSGDATATAYANQTRNILHEDITFEDGHNAFGCWIWACNNAKWNKINGMSYVSKKSDSSGAVLGDGLPMMRYTQFHCSGLDVDNIYFRAKPCSERTTVGFEGFAGMINISTNFSSGYYSHGHHVLGDNIICILGKGDAANSLTDRGIYIDDYGIVNIGDVVFDSCTETTNAYQEEHIRYNGGVSGADGFGMLHIGNVTFGKNCDYSNNIVINNGAATAAQRRLKQLTIGSILSYGQLQYALQILSTSTCFGVQDVKIGSITINGSDNSVYNSASSNSRALSLACSETTDTIKIGSYSVRDKYYVAITDSVNCSVGNFVINDLKVVGITAYWTTDVPVVHMTGLGTPEAAVPANIGSTFNRCDGGAGTCGYRKESGTGNTGWVAK